MDEPNQAPSAEITQAVADSNAAAVASLSTSISGTEPSSGVVSASADPVPLSTSVSSAQEAPAVSGEVGLAALEQTGATDAASISTSTAAFATPSSSTVLPAATAPNATADATASATSQASDLGHGGDAPAVAPVGEPVAAAPSAMSGDGTVNTSDSGTGAPAPDSSFSATTTLSTAAAPDTSSTAYQSAPTTAASSSGSADATLADAGGIPASSPAAVPPETLLARLHADLEALERKIELGIHVFAHEVAAIRDQVKSLI
ncbi:hypothetical protein [Burkholderia gladioli]|uniref:hypothetical protein n=1 Tax=Burkholderia gladioli TaxID=28095 RepID=UPI001902CA20|nr:hypothetical protein [Burkholderia gladioli]MBJ9659849.1 hypothetical protein [Burkholderia gladioli]